MYLWVIARFIQWRAFNRIKPARRALLDISRLDAGVVQPHITTIPVAAVFDRFPLEMLRNEFNVDIPARLVTGDTKPDSRTLIANLLREHTRAA